MQATPRTRAAYAFPFSGSVTPPIPPPPPAVRRNANASPPPVQYGSFEGEPKWLEDAVLRIVKKHGLQIPEPEIRILTEETPDETTPRAIPGVPAPGSFRRAVRNGAVFGILAAAVALAGRYPDKTAAVFAEAKTVAVRVGPPSTWMQRVRGLVHAGAGSASMTLAPPAAREPEAPAPAAPAPVVADTTTAAAPAPEIPAIPVESLAPVAPVAANLAPPSAPSVDAPKAEAKHAAAHVHHAAAPAAVAAAPTPAPAPAPAPAPPPAVADPEPPAGSLAAAIKHAGGGKPAPILDHPAAPAAESKPAVDTSLPDRPSASLVTSALLGVLPDARACMNDGDDPQRASVTFGSNGAVTSVQASGPQASCIQKALTRAHVAPFSQPSYRANVTVRPN